MERVFFIFQPSGNNYSENEIKGYYNDLNEKIIYCTNKKTEIPLTILPNNNEIEFSITIL